jgi:hypothetical protein
MASLNLQQLNNDLSLKTYVEGGGFPTYSDTELYNQLVGQDLAFFFIFISI